MNPPKFTYAHGSCRSHKWRKKMVSEYFRSPRTLYFVICGPWIDKLVQNILAKGEGKWLFWLQNSSEFKFISLVSALLVFYQLGLVERAIVCPIQKRREYCTVLVKCLLLHFVTVFLFYSWISECVICDNGSVTAFEGCDFSSHFFMNPPKFTYAHGSCRSHKWRKKMVSEYFRSPRTLYFVICGPWIDKLVQNILAKGEGKWLFWLQNSSEFKFISLVSALLVFYQLGLVEKGPNRTRPYFAFALANSWTKKNVMLNSST